jgi:hypothetical protein
MSTIPPTPYPYPSPPLQPPRKETSGMAVASLIFGIVGCVPFITGLLAVIFGILGIRRTRDPRYGGSGLAIAGLILGILSLAGWTLSLGAALVAWNASAAARQAAEAFVYDLSRGRIDSAYAMTTQMDRAEFETAAAAIVDQFGASQSVLLFGVPLESVGGGAECELFGLVQFENEPGAAELLLIKVGDEWKVAEFNFE